MNKFKLVTLTSLLFALLFTMVSTTTPTGILQAEEFATEVEWVTYTDPRFDFTVEYPSHWTLHPRDDQPNAIGGRVVFYKPAISAETEVLADTPAKIEIGLYLVEREPLQDLADWSEQYDTNHDEFDSQEIAVLNTETRASTNYEFFWKEAISPLTTYTYANVPHGKIVWFVWMNSIDKKDKAVLNHVVASMAFGPHAPQSLRQVYGENFNPQPLAPSTSDNGLRQTTLWNNHPMSTIVASLSNYRVPVTVHAGIYCGSKNSSKCEGTHKGAAANAIDIRVAKGTNVLAAATSTVYSVQWSNAGYGNLVRLRDTQAGYLAYYAHLDWFVIEPGIPLGQGHFIGVSGDSGAPGAPHLHFHVQTTGGGSISLSGMTGLSLYNYPDCNKSTCAQIQALPNQECQCGHVN